MHVRQPKRHKIRQKLNFADFAKNNKFYKCVSSCEERPFLKDKESKERSKDGNEKRKKRQQFLLHAKRSKYDIPDRMLDRLAIWEEREQESERILEE
ncbi:hypothetical protein HPB47_001442 [Ixodes persulcatus]|uniref:Uncharacterized protein n=1 Tax=Ixodes persulcatus TaxID=34615 RepID=A0AC60PQX5_IXOPE|nr:hypothetical protein HPB47_001442 [Ixodes persulcatus]